ncbi:hypothetical protein MPDQ_001261 [Monascus purpureus]|uniref:Uncharacterized protein n=1 Tax=Monascus purpureus TaxID=5098 RepID=A0A507QSA2_MONPU|nr:hypothetical protein MPDQ_001261 [Monascus purpureus]
MSVAPKSQFTSKYKADPATQPEVDVMVLDYLVCNAINAILRSRIAERQGQAHSWDVAGLLSLSSKFEYIFSRTHAEAPFSQDLVIKLQLLAFISRFLCRSMLEKPFSPSTRKNERADKGISGIPPTVSQSLHSLLSSESRESRVDTTVLDGSSHPVPSLNSRHTKGKAIPLLDTIPDLIALCTLAAAEVSEERWLGLLARFMLQASLETYLDHGEASPEHLNRCFTWTPTEPSRALKWEQERTRYLDHLQPRAGDSLYTHLENLSKEFSMFQLEGIVIEFLVELVRMLKPPVLIQLERGKLEGLSYAETLMFKGQAGL